MESRRYSAKIDIWGAAAVTCEWLTGKQLINAGDEFDALSQVRIFLESMHGYFAFAEELDGLVDQDAAEDLLGHMLQERPERRLSARECLSHMWLADSEEKTGDHRATDSNERGLQICLRLPR